MATDPSPHPHSSRNHARKSTPVIPALPLPLADKTWRRPSQAPTEDADVVTKPAVETVTPLQNGHSNEENLTISPESGPDPDLPNSTAVLDNQRHTSNGQEQVNQLDNDDQSVPNHLATEGFFPVDQEQQQNDVKSGALIAEPAQSVDALQAPLPDSQQALSEIVENTAQQSTEEDHSLPVLEANPEEQRVQIAEEDTQPSDHEASSVQPSSTTAITDYSSTAGESTLETVVGDSYHTRKASGVPHRKSEVAPEVLANGFSSFSTRTNTDPNHADVGQALRAKASSFLSIQEHLLYLASTKQFFDTILCVNHPDQTYQPSEHLSHSLFLSRSESLIKTLSEADPATHPKVINLYPARNILPHAFEAALRFFYSDHILTIQTLIPTNGYQDRQAKEQTFEYIMSYWVAGMELGLLPVKTRAYEMVQELLDWSIAELVAKEIQNLRLAEETLSSSHNKVEVRDIADSLSRLLVHLFVNGLRVEDFTVDGKAQTTTLPTRFAVLEYPRSNNPALSTMVFGSLASESNPPPTPTSIASAILLNINFWDLQLIAEDMVAHQNPHGQRVIRQVIEQREEKRDHVIHNRAIPNKYRLSNSAVWETAGWREYINERGQLAQERVGFLLPSKHR